MKIGFSFRVLANLEYAFIHYLNWHCGRRLEFEKISTADFAFAFGLSEKEYNFEFNKFLAQDMEVVRPIAGALRAVDVLRKHQSEICIITKLDVLHHANIKRWIAKHFNGWRPLVYYTDSMSNTNRNPHWTEIRDVCFTKQLEVFVTENPIDAQQVATLLFEQEVLMLEMPWNRDAHPMFTQEFGYWEEILTEIHWLANGK